jgi:hypothetical protein
MSIIFLALAKVKPAIALTMNEIAIDPGRKSTQIKRPLFPGIGVTLRF